MAKKTEAASVQVSVPEWSDLLLNMAEFGKQSPERIVKMVSECKNNFKQQKYLQALKDYNGKIPEEVGKSIGYTPKLSYWRTVLNVLADAEYSVKHKEVLYSDVKKYCAEHRDITPEFDFRNRGCVLTSRDVDLALRNLMDCKIIEIEENSGLIRLVG